MFSRQRLDVLRGPRSAAWVAGHDTRRLVLDGHDGQVVDVEPLAVVLLHLNAGGVARVTAWPDPDVHGQPGRAPAHVHHQEELVLGQRLGGTGDHAATVARRRGVRASRSSGVTAMPASARARMMICFCVTPARTALFARSIAVLSSILMLTSTVRRGARTTAGGSVRSASAATRRSIAASATG